MLLRCVILDERGQSHLFWVPCQNSMNFLWTRKYGLAPEPFREHPGTTTQKTGNPPGIVPWMIPTPKWSSLFVRPALQLTQTGRRPLTALNLQTLVVIGKQVISVWTPLMWVKLHPDSNFNQQNKQNYRLADISFVSERAMCVKKTCWGIVFLSVYYLTWLILVLNWFNSVQGFISTKETRS